MNTDITNNDKCMKLLDMVNCILNLNGVYCCRCNKTLARKDMKQCNDCKCMIYCSRACQRDDWLNGHNVSCNKPYTDDQVGTFQGRVQVTEPSIERAILAAPKKKLMDLEMNLAMIQLKLFLDNSETILSQARSLGRFYRRARLYDCVVVFDLRFCSPVITVKRYTDHFCRLEEREGFENTRSKDYITCHYYSVMTAGDLEAAGLTNGETANLVMQRLFPHQWLKDFPFPFGEVQATQSRRNKRDRIQQQ